MTDTIRTIADVANDAVTSPDTLSHAEITRLGAWYLDHDEHVAAYTRTLGANTKIAARAPAPTAIDPGKSTPSERLAAQQPAGSLMHLPENQPAAEPTAETPAAETTS